MYEIIGRPFTFEESSVLSALLGSIFGIGYTFRHITILKWYRGPLIKRAIRGLIAFGRTQNKLHKYIGCLIPSALLISFQRSFLTEEWI